MRSLQSHCNTEKVEGKKLLDAGNLIEVPGMIWEICQVLVGETCGGKSSLELQKVGHGSILLRNVLSIFAHRSNHGLVFCSACLAVEAPPPPPSV